MRAPLANVSRTALLSTSTKQTSPSCVQNGTPSGLEGFLYLTTSTAAGSAALIAARSATSTSRFQPLCCAMMSSICSESDFSLMREYLRRELTKSTAEVGRKGAWRDPFLLRLACCLEYQDHANGDRPNSGDDHVVWAMEPSRGYSLRRTCAARPAGPARTH